MLEQLQEGIKQLRARLKRKTTPGAAAKEVEVTTKAETAQSRTVNKKKVYLLCILLLVSFIGSFFIFSKDSAKPKKKTIETADAKLAAPQLSDDYGDLSRLAQKDTKPKTITGKEATVSNRQQLSPGIEREAPARTVYQTYNPGIKPTLPEEVHSARETENRNAAERAQALQEKIWSSAIAFTIKKDGQDSSAGAQSTNSYQAARDNTLSPGTMLPAMLISGINSDNGGQVTAQLTADVYDSFYGDTLLIPMGARLVGTYEGGAKLGESRVNIKWSRILFPNGDSYQMGETLVTTGMDGYPGILGKVDTHGDQVVSAGLVTTALGALSSIAAGNTSSGDSYSASNMAAQGAATNLLNTAGKLMEQKMNRTPTITVEPGTNFFLRVADIVALRPYEG